MALKASTVSYRVPSSHPRPPGKRFTDFLVLTKPGIVIALVVTAFTGMVVAKGALPPFGLAALTLAGLGLSASGGASFNMWFDRDIDGRMERTRRRPLPSGRLTPATVLTFAILLAIMGTTLLALLVNWLAAGLALAGTLWYAGVYTAWLKRRTPHAVIIGGVAGGLAPLVGAAAATGHVDTTALAMGAVIFFWSAPHFWFLAWARRSDYANAHIPTLPARLGLASTRAQGTLYAVLTLAVSVLPYFFGTEPLAYAIGATILGIWFVFLATAPDGRRRGPTAFGAFLDSIVYLVLLFTLLAIGPFLSGL